MYPIIPTKDPTAVEVEIQRGYLEMFPGDKDHLFVPRAFGWVLECFTGSYRNYAPVDTVYHDYEHTLQGTVCMARLLGARHRTGVAPILTPQTFQLGLLAILFHDTGYLKKRGDTEGTGAKYTATHVDRSAHLAGVLLAEKGLTQQQIQSVKNMIHCTGISVELDAIPFQSELERVVGFALGTADLLGQMAADDYVDKLPTLYSEFEEAVHFTKDKSAFIASFKGADDLLRKTPSFWKNIVQPKLQNDFIGLYRYLNDPYPDGPNPYIERVEANIQRIEAMFGATAALAASKQAEPGA